MGVLGLTAPFDEKDIKNAYRRCAKLNHPDLGGDPHKFQLVQLAYETLKTMGVSSMAITQNSLFFVRKK